VTAPVDRAEARIEAALSRLGAEHEPPPGWERRVLAAVRDEPRRRPWWQFAAPAVVVAAAAVLLVLVVMPPRPHELALDLQFGKQAVTRGAQADERQVGETVHATASGGGRNHAIWVYRNELALEIACPRDPVCRVSGDAVSVDFVLRTVGEYKILALSSDAALPEPRGNYDADAAAAMRADLTIKPRVLHVR
jgi:hypothetical protein